MGVYDSQLHTVHSQLPGQLPSHRPAAAQPTAARAPGQPPAATAPMATAPLAARPAALPAGPAGQAAPPEKESHLVQLIIRE